MNKKISLINFSGIYNEQDFYKKFDYQIIDLSSISSDDCYCSQDSERKIIDRLHIVPVNQIHFIDSGNYHYVSKFFIDRIKENFTLVVFDHHTDMEDDVNMLTCGNWLFDIIKNNKYVKQVFLIGIKNKKEILIPLEYKNRLEIFDENDIKNNLIKLNIKYPVYLSIDKDVFNSHIITTNWEQGILDVNSFEEIIEKIENKKKIFGCDVCGETSLRIENTEKIKRDNEFNLNLVNFIYKKV